MLGRAGGAVDLAFPWFEYALEYLATLTGLRVGDTHTWYGVAQFGVEVRVGVRELEGRLGYKAHPPPLEVRTKLEDLGHALEGRKVAFPGADPASRAAPAQAGRSLRGCRTRRSFRDPPSSPSAGSAPSMGPWSRSRWRRRQPRGRGSRAQHAGRRAVSRPCGCQRLRPLPPAGFLSSQGRASCPQSK